MNKITQNNEMNSEMNSEITRADLMNLEEYAEKRSAFRKKVLKHKKQRQVALGPNSTLYFENKLTLLYQIQEMLRIEKIFEAEGINEEIAAYSPMVPNGRNLKATYMIEYEDAEIRAAQLGKMTNIEDLVWIQVEGHDKVWAISDEDLERSNDVKTSAVHFMRFEFNDNMVKDLKTGADLRMGVQHAIYTYELEVEGETKISLVKDLS